MSTAQTQNRPVKIAKPYNDEAIEQAVVSVLRSGMLVQGTEVKEFETKLSQYIGCRNVIAVNSGTSALQLAIDSVKNSKRPGNKEKNAIPEIVTTPLSFAATANAALGCDVTPVFADVDPETFNIDPSEVEEKIRENTIAIEPVDIYGLPADLEKLKQIGKARDLALVEDAAEAMGASYKGKKIGNISDLSCFSTYATKNLHTGEGGFITTNDDALADFMRMGRNQGQASRYNQKILGYNFRMLEICAAIGIEQLKILDALNDKRREHAQALMEGLGDIEFFGFQRVDDPKTHSWYMFAVTLDERRAGQSRDELVKQLRGEGIEADVSWPTPIHLQPYYKEIFGYKEGDFPVAEKICQTVFQLPIQPFLTQGEVERTVTVLRRLVNA